MMPSTPTAAPPADPTLAFASLTDEIVVDGLDVDGEVPAWLTGALLRTGPARFDTDGGAVAHLFDGQAMLHRFAFDGGRVSYANRLLRGKAGRALEQTGELGYREFATDPCRRAFERVQSIFDARLTDNGNVNIAKVGERWLAMTETPMAVAFDPATLESLESVRRVPRPPLGERLPVAHPHLDPETKEQIGLRVVFGPRSRYELVAQRSLTEERVIATIAVREPGYQHSFSLTPRHAVITESPLVVDPLRFAFSGRPFIENYRWERQRGGRVWCVERATGAVSGPWRVDAHFCFHHINAYEDGGRVVVDLLAYDDASVVDELALGRLRDGALPSIARPVRLVVDPSRGAGERLELEPLADVRFELPRIDEARDGQPYRFAYGAGATGAEPRALFDAIVKLDVDDGTVTAWSEPGTLPGEPVFAARPDRGDDDEDGGVLLSVLLEPARRRSSLLVLDARDLTELARAHVPHHIPLSFHGGYSPRL